MNVIIVHLSDGQTDVYTTSLSNDDVQLLAVDYLERHGVECPGSMNEVDAAFGFSNDSAVREARWPDRSPPDDSFAEFAELTEANVVEVFLDGD